MEQFGQKAMSLDAKGADRDDDIEVDELEDDESIVLETLRGSDGGSDDDADDSLEEWEEKKGKGKGKAKAKATKKLK